MNHADWKKLANLLWIYALFAFFVVKGFGYPSAATYTQFNGAATSGTLTSGTTITLGRLGGVSTYGLTLGTGPSTYTAQVVLSDSSIHPGDLYFIPVSYPATAGTSAVSLQVFDSGTGGTLLHSSTSTGIAGSTVLRFVNVTGTSWSYSPEGAVLARNLGTGVQAALAQAVNTGSGLVSGTALASGSAAVSGSAVTSGSAAVSGSAGVANAANSAATAVNATTASSANALTGTAAANFIQWTGAGTAPGVTAGVAYTVSPAPLSSGSDPATMPALQGLWYMDGAAVSDTNNLLVIADSSGNGNTAFSYSGPNQPGILPSAINYTRSALHFTGTSNNILYLQTPGATDPFGSGHFTGYFVGRYSKPQENSELIYNIGAIGNAGWQLATTGTAFNQLFFYTYGSSSGANSITYPYPVASSLPFIATVSYSGTTKYISLNGVFNSANWSDTINNGGTACAGAYLQYGPPPISGYSLDGDIFAIAISGTGSTPAQQYPYINRFAQRYGIPITVPVVFDGNSLTNGYPLSSSPTGHGPQSYPAQCGGLLGPGYWIENTGSNSRTTEQMLVTGSNYYPQFANAQEVIVVLQEGVNSMQASVNNESAATAVATMTSLVSAVRAQATNYGCKVKVVVNTIPQAAPSGDTALPAKITTYNAALVSGSTGADTVALMGTDSRLQTPANTTYFQADEIHLTAAGYAIEAQYDAAAIQAVR
jgi:lysophospholipase L1-like esterase